MSDKEKESKYNTEIDTVLLKKRVDKWIKDNKSSQGKLAKEADLDASTLSNMLRGVHKPSIEKLLRLANAMQCDINYLLREDSSETPEMGVIKNITGLTDDSIKYLRNLKTDGFDDELAIINSVLSYKKIYEILTAINGYRLNRDIVDGSSAKPKYHQMLFEEYTRYRIKPAYRDVFIGKMIKSLKADRNIIQQIEEKRQHHSYDFELFREINTRGLSKAEATMVKDFYDYEKRLFIEYELTARELQIHRLFMNYLELY